MFCIRPYVVRFLHVKISQSVRVLCSSVCGSVSTYRDITVPAYSVFGPYVVRFLHVKISQSCVFCVRPYVVRFLHVKISQSVRVLCSSVCGSVSTYRDITVRACSVFGLYVVRFLHVKISQSVCVLCSVCMWFGFYV